MNSSVLALARKWRPQEFSQLIGQELIVKALTYALNNQRWHHAYLFSGTRGVGKTTIARIIAKCFNCLEGISATPCRRCNTCLEIEAGKFIDLIEIDAASRTKVEDTRDLLANTLYAPTQGRYKIYLIDEVHMLSGHSFNALLKTLEEPPPHVIFLLATTDPQKLPITILSRCLQFQLKPIPPQILLPYLKNILLQENISAEDKGLALLAQAAQGSARDALSLLDQATAIGNGIVSEAVVTDMLGIQGQHLILPLAKQILEQNVEAVLKITAELASIGADFEFILSQLLQLFHDLAIKQLSPNFILDEIIITNQDLTLLAQNSDENYIQLLYQIALLAKRDLYLAPNPLVGFEMAMMRMIAFRINNIEVSSKNEVLKKTEAKPKATPKESPPLPNLDNTIKNTSNNPWNELLPQLNLTAFSKALAEHLSFDYKEGNHFYFILDQKYAAMLQEKHRLRIQDALSQYFNSPFTVTIKIGSGGNYAPSPIEKKMADQKASTENALKKFNQDPALNKLLNNFDGKILSDTIELS